jgi:hypothetical protein
MASGGGDTADDSDPSDPGVGVLNPHAVGIGDDNPRPSCGEFFGRRPADSA